MTARKIVIRDCGECPRSDHKGALGKVFRIPVCRKADRELPWTPIACGTGFVSAKREPGVPDWCPLPKDTGGAQYPTPVQPASAPDRVKAAPAHGAHAIDAGNVPEQRQKITIAEAVWRLMDTLPAREVLSRCLYGDLRGTEEAVIWVTIYEQSMRSDMLPAEISFAENYAKIAQGNGACPRHRIDLMLKSLR